MDSSFDKEAAAVKLKAAALQNRSQSVLALAAMLSEYAQLTGQLVQQLDAANARLRAYEEKTVKPVDRPVPEPAPARPG